MDDFADFLKEMLGITKDYGIVEIEKFEPEKIIKVHLAYLPNHYMKDGKKYSLYDKTPEREWQHLSWFEYRCYLVCSLPRYVDKDGKVKVIEPVFADKGRGYTHRFSRAIIETLQKVRVQKTVAEILQTTPYIVRSVMDEAVERAIEKRGLVNDFKNVSLDEKAYAQGHEYATILIDSDKEHVVEMVEGRDEISVKGLFFCLSGEETQPQIERVNVDMWRPYMNAMHAIAPQALLVHDKFHLFKKLSEAIDKTRREEVNDNDLLRSQKYTVLKNAENRNEKQRDAFEKINQANLKTAQAWHVRENFKSIFILEDIETIKETYQQWVISTLGTTLKHVHKVVATFERHRTGVLNALISKTTSGKHENMNGKIQSVIAKARGFINFERFRVNALFYFGGLQLLPQKI
jgi:transposase